jgi:uncharacterized protein (TIGR01777 family)
MRNDAYHSHMITFEKRSRLPVPARAAFNWHSKPGAFQRLQPPWESVWVVAQKGGITDGATVELKTRVGPVTLRIVALHEGYIEGKQFRDVQQSGPFKRWEHTHLITPDGNDACWLTDHIEYELPLGALGRFFGGAMVQKKLERMFTYRHRVTADDLRSHAATSGKPPMKIAVSGAGGLIGSALLPFLTTGGHDVWRVVRPGSRPTPMQKTIAWDPDAGHADLASLEGFDAVVHLGGCNLADRRWSAKYKEQMMASRVESTRLLAESIAKLARKPRVLVCASATGFYGNRGDEVLTESSEAGSNFLADLCGQWEAAARPAIDAGVRVVFARFGIVLTPQGGALAKLLTPFRMGVGGTMGDGSQYWSAVAIDDAIGAIHHALITDTLDGPMNVVALESTTNLELTNSLANVLHRPAMIPVPGAAARLFLGELADEALLASARVQPSRLIDTGYRFRFPRIEPAIRHVLGIASDDAAR